MEQVLVKYSEIINSDEKAHVKKVVEELFITGPNAIREMDALSKLSVKNYAAVRLVIQDLMKDYKYGMDTTIEPIYDSNLTLEEINKLKEDAEEEMSFSEKYEAAYKFESRLGGLVFGKWNEFKFNDDSLPPFKLYDVQGVEIMSDSKVMVHGIETDGSWSILDVEKDDITSHLYVIIDNPLYEKDEEESEDKSPNRNIDKDGNPIPETINRPLVTIPSDRLITLTTKDGELRIHGYDLVPKKDK